MRLFKWIRNNILFLATLFLLAFIPLYPKIPLLDVKNTWVYIRAEDFVVVFVMLIWILLLLFKKVTLKTPLTLPIILFWIVGGLSTLHGVLLIFPTIANVFPNVAFLSFLRRIEYLSLFFIAFTAMKDKRHIYYVVTTLVIVLFLVVGYGIGQKFLGFPAYLTMNEEFAKGIPIQLSQLSRVPSTFAGHYDLAAYLVLIIPILISLVFGFKNFILKIFLLVTASLGFALIFMTVSRVSFFVLLLSLIMLLILQKKRFFIVSLFLIAILFLSFSTSLLARFGSTVSEVDVLVDAKTGGAIGHVKEVPSEYFKNKVVLRQLSSKEESSVASSSAILPFSLIPEVAHLVVEGNASTGENLPQGTSYINLPLSPVTKKIDQFFYQKSSDLKTMETHVFYGDYLIKRAKAYDLSFTTRFQGEWPNTILAFKRNIILGSGYGSVSLAVDNNYLRILGESGLIGFVAFFSIFLIGGIYIKRVLPNVDSPVVRSFVLGFVAGTFGLMLNAVFIDVFEASKIAFTFWLLMGVTIGILQLYKKEKIDFFKELIKVVSSTYAIIIYLLIITVVLFSSSSNYYFVGDDFTWFRWVSDGHFKNGIFNYLTEANGFFYRPGAKLYFSLMYSAFWLNQTMYHLISIILHFSTALLLFLIFKRILKDYFLSAVTAVLFLALSGHHEAVFWISSTGFLFNAVFVLLGFLLFIYWKEKKKIIYLVLSLISIAFSLLFHELGVIAPLLIIAYDAVFGEKFITNKLRKIYYLIFLSPILPYLILRYLSNSHWLSGDYSYNLLKLPYNIVGNTIGYLLLSLFGPASLPLYQGLRNFSREHVVFAILASVAIIFIIVAMYRMIIRNMMKEEQKIVIFGSLFFIISLLPFLGLGNISSRYSYLSSAGFVILLAFFIKKIYGYLISSNGRYISVTSVIMIVFIFFMVHLFQLQKIHTDWQAAGEKSKRFLISVEEYSKDFWIRDSMQFYFVNLPIKRGEAWVWPVGLKDALWFTFKNPRLAVYAMSDINLAFDQAAGSSSSHVFRFDDNGNVEEVVRTKNRQIRLLNPPR